MWLLLNNVNYLLFNYRSRTVNGWCCIIPENVINLHCREWPDLLTCCSSQSWRLYYGLHASREQLITVCSRLTVDIALQVGTRFSVRPALHRTKVVVEINTDTARGAITVVLTLLHTVYCKISNCSIRCLIVSCPPIRPIAIWNQRTQKFIPVNSVSYTHLTLPTIYSV